MRNPFDDLYAKGGKNEDAASQYGEVSQENVASLLEAASKDLHVEAATQYNTASRDEESLPNAVATI